MLVQFLANQFDLTGRAFAPFVLSPVDRRLILLGKKPRDVAGGRDVLFVGARDDFIMAATSDLAAVAAVFNRTLLLLGSLGR